MAIMRRSGSENDNSSSSERHQQDEAQCQPRERAHQLRQRCKEGGMRFHLGGWCDGRDGVTQRSHLPGSSARNQVNVRSEERRVGKECVGTCRSRWSPTPQKKKRSDKHKQKNT